MNRALVFTLTLVAACRSQKERAFEQLATNLNPILMTTIPKLSAFIALARTEGPSSEKLLSLCRNADLELTRMSHVDLPDSLHLDPRKSRLDDQVRLFMEERDRLCWDPAANGIRSTCPWFCADRWHGIVGDVERLAHAAQDEGVELFALPDVPDELRHLH